MPKPFPHVTDNPDVREDILDRRSIDRANNPITVALLRQRMDAVARAADACGTFQMAEPYELRQMLIDLAAACEEWAGALPAPGVLTLRQQARRQDAAA